MASLAATLHRVAKCDGGRSMTGDPRLVALIAALDVRQSRQGLGILQLVTSAWALRKPASRQTALSATSTAPSSTRATEFNELHLANFAQRCSTIRQGRVSAPSALLERGDAVITRPSPQSLGIIGRSRAKPSVRGTCV